MRVRWTTGALRDLQDIGAFISRDNPAAARRWVNLLQDRAEQIVDFPRSGRVVPELEREEIREILFEGYRIAYFLSSSEISIMAVFEGHRRFPSRRVVPTE